MPQKYNYNAVTPAVVREISDICGAKYVIYNDHEKMEAFSHDETIGKEYQHMPDVVVRPSCAKEISQIMKLANRENIPVTPRGAGSGLSGGAVPIYGGILLYFDRMNKIVELDKNNMMLTVEPGIVANEINVFLKPHNLFYAGYPMSLETCFIGGNVAENAGGGKAVKYGVTSRYVLGLEVVTPTGDIVELGGKLVKDVSGYNMVPLMAGSEGTLCVFTKIILKLLPLPKKQIDMLCLFKDTGTAINAVPAIMTSCGIIPTSIEFMDQDSFQSSCKYLNETLPYKSAGAMLLLSVDGSDESQTEKEYEAICEFLTASAPGLVEIYVADNPTTSERIWKIRKNIPEAYNIITPRQCGEDIVVPPASIPQILKAIKDLEKKYGLVIPAYGHAGDGNLHARISCPADWSEEKWHDTIHKALPELYTETAKLGGKISGEHGIGHKRKKYMPYVVSEEYLNMLRAVKKALDPNNILNPGKIFDL
jgi:glycolate oxidase